MSKILSSDEFMENREQAIQDQLILLREKVNEALDEGRKALFLKNAKGENSRFFDETVRIIEQELMDAGFVNVENRYWDNVSLTWEVPKKRKPQPIHYHDASEIASFFLIKDPLMKRIRNRFSKTPKQQKPIKSKLVVDKLLPEGFAGTLKVDGKKGVFNFKSVTPNVEIGDTLKWEAFHADDKWHERLIMSCKAKDLTLNDLY